MQNDDSEINQVCYYSIYCKYCLSAILYVFFPFSMFNFFSFRIVNDHYTIWANN